MQTQCNAEQLHFSWVGRRRISSGVRWWTGHFGCRGAAADESRSSLKAAWMNEQGRLPAPRHEG
jgi:hypothetical protein